MFKYYPPATSRYCRVEQGGNLDKSQLDKVCSSQIKIGAEIGIPGIIKATFDYVRSHCTNENNAEVGKAATKEQRDTLMKAMADAGYIFDFESKELRKIEKPIEWSYEDEANLNNIIWLCNNCIKGTETTWIPSQATKIKHLIETIKEEGLAQQNPAWSEEDEQIILSIEQVMNCASLLNIVPEKMDKIRTWLKALKQRIGE